MTYRVMWLHSDGCGLFEDRTQPFHLGGYPARTWEDKAAAIAFADERQQKTDAAGHSEHYHVLDERGGVVYRTTPNPAELYHVHYYKDRWHVLSANGQTFTFTVLSAAQAAGQEQGEYIVYRIHDYYIMASSVIDRQSV